MDIILGMFYQLKGNSTVFIQLVLFLFGYVVISNVLFKPYLAAYEERKKRTEGNEQVAERTIAETKDLELVYEEKARSLSSEHKAIYDQSRSEALHAHDEIVTAANKKAKDLLEATKGEIASELEKTRAELSAEAPLVSKTIVNHLAGKDLV